MKTIVRSLLLSTLLGISTQTHAGTLTGIVATPEGQPVAGAMVTLWNEAHNRKETVYSDIKGRYTLDTGFTGKLILRARASNYKDFNLNLALSADGRQSHNLALVRLTDPQEISNQLTASAHAAALPFPDAQTKRAFISQCSYCHQQGNSLTRRARTKDEWSDTVWRMEGYGALITYREHKRITDMYDKGFTGKPVVVEQQITYAPEQTHARIEEWHVGNAMSFLHDTFVGQDDLLYGIDEGQDMIYLMDRKTSKIEEIKMPVTDDVGLHGRFGGFKMPIGIFTGQHGPHSAAQIKDGRIYITAALSGKLLEFNPKTREWKHHKIPEGFLWRKGLYPHTIRTDKDDNLWFTVTMSNRVMKFDPKTEQFTDIATPHGGFLHWFTDTFFGVVLKIANWFPEKNLQLALSHHKWLNGGEEVMSWPYGIDVSPTTGEVWYSKLLANKIGVVNKETMTVTEYDTPFKGPRRMRFGPDGMLWIPSFDDGKLARFDPATKAFEMIDLPVLSKGEYEMPYALNVHQKTGDVWIAANNTDRVLRYLPKEKRFIAYPMPNRVVWFRDLEFTQDGKVCTSNANLPAYAHEDQVPAFVCIEPEPNGAYGPSHG
jgi:streptogramin lyase/cytochrome c5